MIDYSDHQPYREGSSTPVLDDDMLDEYGQPRRGFKITEVGVDEYSPVHSDQYEDFDPQEHYDIQYGSGELSIQHIYSTQLALNGLLLVKRKHVSP